MADFRILVVRLSSMGDVIHTLPAAASLKHGIPNGRLTWLIRPRWAPLLAGNPYVDEIVPVERSLAASFKEARRLRAQHFDLAVDFQGLIQSAALAAAVRPAKLAGFDRKRVRERPAALFYSSEVETHAEHAVERNLELAAGAGAAQMLRTFPLPAGAPEGSLPPGKFVLTSPLAGWGAKQWPLEYWSQLAGLMDLPLVVNGPPDAAPVLQQIRGAHVHLSGLPGLIDATRRSHAVIGVDSGPLHLAAALSKPGVAIYGPTSPARNGPYGGTIRVLRNPDAMTDYSRSSIPHASMLAISPRMVADALAAALDAKSAGCPRVSFPKPYADAIAKLRVPFGFVLVAAFLWLSEPTLASLAAGLPVSILGLALRGWAAGHLEKDRTLTESGPYAWVRNPLYLGTLTAAAGLAVASRRWELGVLFACVFVLIYLPVVNLEEQHLADLFPAYAGYIRRVPQLIPRLPRQKSAKHFRWSLYQYNREYQASVGFLAGVALLLWKALR